MDIQTRKLNLLKEIKDILKGGRSLNEALEYADECDKGFFNNNAERELAVKDIAKEVEAEKEAKIKQRAFELYRDGMSAYDAVRRLKESYPKVKAWFEEFKKDENSGNTLTDFMSEEKEPIKPEPVKPESVKSEPTKENPVVDAKPLPKLVKISSLFTPANKKLRRYMEVSPKSDFVNYEAYRKACYTYRQTLHASMSDADIDMLSLKYWNEYEDKKLREDLKP